MSNLLVTSTLLLKQDCMIHAIGYKRNILKELQLQNMSSNLSRCLCTIAVTCNLMGFWFNLRLRWCNVLRLNINPRHRARNLPVSFSSNTALLLRLNTKCSVIFYNRTRAHACSSVSIIQSYWVTAPLYTKYNILNPTLVHCLFIHYVYLWSTVYICKVFNNEQLYQLA